MLRAGRRGDRTLLFDGDRVSEKHYYIHIYSNMIYNSSNMQTAQVLTDGSMNKQTVAYVHNKIIAQLLKGSKIEKHGRPPRD